MSQILFNCDDVFEQLTAGPFPQGQADDEHIREHLSGCLACRELAEALRPACNILHEALSPAERATLPMFVDGDAEVQRIMQGIKQETSVAAGASMSGRRLVDARQVFWMVFAASVLLFAGTALVAWSGTSNNSAHPPISADSRLIALNLPTECGWLCGADAKPHATGIGEATCSECHAGRSADAGSLRRQCCTACHGAGAGKPRAPVRRMATLLAACQECHR